MYKNKKFLLVFLSSGIFIIVLSSIYFFLLKIYTSDEQVPSDDIQNVANSALNNAKKAMQDNQEMLRTMPKKDYSKAPKFDRGSIKIVQEPNFQEVAEKPKTQIEVLQEMANVKKKPVLELKDSDLNKKVNLYYQSYSSEKQIASFVPSIEEDLKIPKKTMISAPVSYKIFKQEKDWKEFVNTHKVREIKPDFNKYYILLLVSTSELPNGIFKADSFKQEKDKVVVFYRVDPLEMASDNPNGTQTHYSAINIPKTEKVKLQQIP